MNAPIDIYTRMQARKHASTQARKHARTHVRTDARTHEHTLINACTKVQKVKKVRNFFFTQRAYSAISDWDVKPLYASRYVEVMRL